MLGIIENIHRTVWGLPTLAAFIVCGLVFTVRMRFIQLNRFGLAARTVFSGRGSRAEGRMSPTGALTTALAATLGTGNIVGVATAIAAGGAGAVFWIWVSAFLGMATHYAETVLAVIYREERGGERVGGPMYYMKNGLKSPALGGIFAFFLLLSSFGMGNMAQSNSIASAAATVTELPPYAVGGAVCLLVGIVMLGGVRRLEALTLKIVPFAAILYLSLSVVIIICNRANLPDAFKSIFVCALSPNAIAGGVAGSALRYGFARGVFANEAGLGSSVIMHAETAENEPARQGLYAIMEVFIDTTVVCTISALAVLSGGSHSAGLSGAALVSSAFASVFGSAGRWLLAFIIILFSFTSLVGWSHYGARAALYLFGVRSVGIYNAAFLLLIVPAAGMNLSVVWLVCDILNALMALPNIAAVLVLGGEVVTETARFMKKQGRRA